MNFSNYCAILAGGLNRRMGMDKALLQLDGTSLIQRLLNDLSQNKMQALILSGSKKYPFNTEGIYLVDALPGKEGPLSAILSALQYVAKQQQNGVWIMSCDTLILPSQLKAEALLQVDMSQNSEIIYCHSKQQSFPLLAYYSTNLILALHNYLLSGNRRVMQFIQQHTHQIINLPDSYYRLCNFNTPEEFERAKRQ